LGFSLLGWAGCPSRWIISPRQSSPPTNTHPSYTHPTNTHPSYPHPITAHPSSSHPTNAHTAYAHPTSAHPPSTHPCYTPFPTHTLPTQTPQTHTTNTCPPYTHPSYTPQTHALPTHTHTHTIAGSTGPSPICCGCTTPATPCPSFWSASPAPSLVTPRHPGGCTPSACTACHRTRSLTWRAARRRCALVGVCCGVLCCAVLCCAVLCCSVLFCSVLFCAVLCFDLWHRLHSLLSHLSPYSLSITAHPHPTSIHPSIGASPGASPARHPATSLVTNPPRTDGSWMMQPPGRRPRKPRRWRRRRTGRGRRGRSGRGWGAGGRGRCGECGVCACCTLPHALLPQRTAASGGLGSHTNGKACEMGCFELQLASGLREHCTGAQALQFDVLSVCIASGMCARFRSTAPSM